MDLKLEGKEILLVSVIILMILAWLIGNLGAVYFGMEDEEVRGSPEREEYDDRDQTPLAFDLPDFLGNLLFATAILGFGGWFFFSQESLRSKGIIGAVFLGFISVIRFSDRIMPIVFSALSRLKSVFPEIEDSYAPDIGIGDGSEPIFSPVDSSIWILLFFISILIVIFFFIRHKKLSEDEVETEEDISSTADRAITELHEGEGVRDIIIRNYQKMLIILEKEGVEQDISFTPRELENIALERLPLEERTIDEMTKLFELAKYSDHPLGDKERTRAIDNFKQIREELGGNENA